MHGTGPSADRAATLGLVATGETMLGNEPMPVPEPLKVLVVRSSSHLCALPLSAVRETLRPLPCHELPEMPDYVLGLSRIRGQTVPVVDLGRILDGPGANGRAGRFVSLRLGDRSVALAVEAVIDVLEVEASTLSTLPALLSSSDADIVQSIGHRDQQLLLVLDAGRIVPAQLWDRLASQPLP